MTPLDRLVRRLWRFAIFCVVVLAVGGLLDLAGVIP